jgi:hypothetical protein
MILVAKGLFIEYRNPSHGPGRTYNESYPVKMMRRDKNQYPADNRCPSDAENKKPPRAEVAFADRNDLCFLLSFLFKQVEELIQLRQDHDASPAIGCPAFLGVVRGHRQVLTPSGSGHLGRRYPILLL